MAKTAEAPFQLPDRPIAADIVAKYFRGFGDATRLRILQLLREREHSVGDLSQRLEASQPKISNHLACLRWCGFVTSRREHRTIYYHVTDDRVGQMIDLAHALLADNAEHIAACQQIDAKGGS